MKLNLFLLSAAAMVNAAIASGVRTGVPPPYEDAVDLRTAGNYAILAAAGISTVPPSVIVGNIAVSPIAGGAITGFSETDPPSTYSRSDQVVGRVYAANYIAPTPGILTIAVGDMETAYTDAAARIQDPDKNNLGAGVIDDMTLLSGVYTFGTNIWINSKVTFSGTSTDVFIIRTTGNLLVGAAGPMVILEGNAKAENIFWQVAGQVTVCAGAHLEGVLLVKTAAVFQTGSTLNGRILAQTAVTLDSATITQKPTITEPST
jgi:hypothetical protein